MQAASDAQPKISVIIPGHRRCRHEGISKASVVRLGEVSAEFERERRHVAVVIPAALLRNLGQCVTDDMVAFMRFTALFAGLTSALAGYLTGRGWPGARRSSGVAVD